MRNPPPEVVATWPRPNYDDPVHRGPALLIVEVTIMSVAILTLLARLYVRIFKVNKHGLDDWLMLAAMVNIPPLPDLGSCSEHVQTVDHSRPNADLWDSRSLVLVLPLV